MVKVFALNGNGKIEMTEAELKKLLDDAYWDGYRDGGKGYTWSCSPTWSPYITTSTSKSITIDGSNFPKAVYHAENTEYITVEDTLASPGTEK